MNHKSKAKCRNGHIVEFGPCNKESARFFILKSVCTSVNHAAISSFEVRCLECKKIHVARYCPACNDAVPVGKFASRASQSGIA